VSNCVCTVFYGLIDELEIKNMDVLRIGIGFGVFGARVVAKLYKFRSSDSFSPRRELQGSIQHSESSNSLKRPRLGLGDILSRLGKIGSPKQGRDGILY